MNFGLRPRDEWAAAVDIPPPLSPISPKAAQDLAVALAHVGIGQVSPNPLVGAVLVDRHHRFVAAGAHRKLGAAHAEVDVLQKAAATYGEEGASGVVYRGGTIYVTLEPCAHHGRTPACAPRLAQSGLGRCVFGSFDPNPLVAGKGAKLAAAHGMLVEHDPTWQAACERLAEVFLHNMTQRRPFVALKVGASLDGVMARRGDARAWITGSRARRYAHFLRVVYDGIVVGRGTLVADDPILDARDSLVKGRAPRRIVLDPRGAGAASFHARGVLPRLLQETPGEVQWIVAAEVREGGGAAAAAASWLEKAGVRVEVGSLEARGRLELEPMLESLRAEGLQSLMLEGGAGLYGAFLEAQLVDRVHLFQAPTLMGGGVQTLGFTAGVEGLALRLRDVAITPLEADWLVEGRCSWERGP